MAYNMKITMPPKKAKRDHRTEGNRKLREAGKKRKAFFEQGESYLLGPQKPQSPIKQWADMSEKERREIRERLGAGE